ncbi:UNVERIFIED_CONTAM: ABC transporter F family member 4 [Sesamum angustifolium]|uniref:ABC transporter F family member 4 n=1 Tax=Sesamum angustifolium TaxID=2727405 RepID=A0AAW2RP56_9LAMI
MKMVLILVCDSEFSVSDLVCEGETLFGYGGLDLLSSSSSSNSSDRARYMSLCLGLSKGVKAAIIMGKKKSDEGSTKAKQGGNEKLSVSALLASMDAKPDKPKKAASSKPKPKVAQKVSSYTDGIDLPSSDEEDGVLDSEEEQKQNDIQKKQVRQNRSAATLDITVSDKELKKREKKDFFATQAAELAKQEALKDDRDAFTVVIGSRASVLDGGDDADANVKDITVDNFSVSARGKELLKNASVKISHGKRYGLVGPNGMGKSTLLKLLAWRKIPVPKNIDVLLVEQEVVGDDRSAIEAVVSANEELIKLRQEVAALQDSCVEMRMMMKG